jgi:hypothetical protein
MSDIKIVIFANCHGHFYERDLIKHVPEIKEKNITRFISFEDLDKFDKISPFFKSADIIINQPITEPRYKEFHIDNILNICKSNCILIKAPYARFNGYWPYKGRSLSKIGPAICEDFPFIKNNIEEFLSGDYLNSKNIEDHYEKCLSKLKNIESTGDIPFVNYFVQNHKKFPMFKDYKHPTNNLMNEISKKVVERVSLIAEFNLDKITNAPIQEPFLNGHYAPIQDKVQEVLGLKYNLDSVYMIDRNKYLQDIIKYEADTSTKYTNDIEWFTEKCFKVKRTEQHKPATAI